MTVATQAQREANRRNARRSTGPKSEEGKARSRENALKHGMTGEGVVTPQPIGAARQRYEATFARLIQPTTIQQSFLIGQAALAVARMEHLPELEDALRAEDRFRAANHWEDDRCDAARKRGERLLQRPEKIAGELERTVQGVAWLLEQWRILRNALEDKGAWSVEQKERAGALLGIPIDQQPFESRIRKLKTADDGRALVAVETERLRELQRRLSRLDAQEREMAVSGYRFDDSPQAWRLRRQEQACFRKLRWAETELERIQAGAGRLLWNDSSLGDEADGSAVSADRIDDNANPEATERAACPAASAPATPASEAPSTTAAEPPAAASAPAESKTPKRSQSSEDQFSKDLRAAAEWASDPSRWLLDELKPPPPLEPVKKGMNRRERRRAKREAQRRASAPPR